MTTLCVVGGKLQGIEAVYLAKKCGFNVRLIDRNQNVPAFTMADEFYKADIVKSPADAKRIIVDTDAVIPASENFDMLYRLEKLCRESNVLYMHDNDAFQISSDKSRSHLFLREIGVARPRIWPDASFPLIMKPICGSGSRNVNLIENENKLKDAFSLQGNNENFIVEEFIIGPALSLEAFGKDGVPSLLQVTSLEFDSSYGCKRVSAPVELSETVQQRLFDAAERTVKGLGLTGLTDIQAIVDSGGIPRVNEINARLPSQTPTVVYHSTGFNMVEQIFNLFSEDKLPKLASLNERAVIYQHVIIRGDTLHVKGEHVMAEAVGLEVLDGFMGSDEAITNMVTLDGADGCVGTFIVSGLTLQEAIGRMDIVRERLMNEFNLARYLDKYPKLFLA